MVLSNSHFERMCVQRERAQELYFKKKNSTEVHSLVILFKVRSTKKNQFVSLNTRGSGSLVISIRKVELMFNFLLYAFTTSVAEVAGYNL